MPGLIINYFIALLFAFDLVMLPNISRAADIKVQHNEDSGLYSWVAESEGFSIELIQLLPDFIRAI